MRRFRFAALLLVALAAHVIHAAEEEQRSERIQDAALRAMFSGREMSDQVHYAYQFHPQGHLTGVNLQEKVTGGWRTAEGQLCLTWGQPGEGEECYEVRKDGDIVFFLQNNIEVFYGYLTNIEQKPRQ